MSLESCLGGQSHPEGEASGHPTPTSPRPPSTYLPLQTSVTFRMRSPAACGSNPGSPLQTWPGFSLQTSSSHFYSLGGMRDEGRGERRVIPILLKHQTWGRDKTICL